MVKILMATIAMTLLLAGCGGGDDTNGDDPGGDVGGVGESAASGGSAGADFDPSQLPADFPTEVIPSDYDFASYAELGTTLTASFETDDPVSDTIDRYEGLLGAPSNLVDSDGEMTAQWTDGDWVISVIGSSSESIIGATKISG